MSTGFLNGNWGPLDSLQISVLDRGFLFGDGLYEVVPVFDGKLVYCDRHYERMQRTASELRMGSLDDYATWLDIVAGVLRQNPDCRGVYYQMTRGAGTQRNHIPEEGMQPTRFAMPLFLPSKPTTEVSVQLQEDPRWHRCDLKTTSLLGHLLPSLQSGGGEMIFLRDNLVTEGSSSNVFAVVNGQVRTTPSDWRILPGITRDVLVEISQQSDQPVLERNISREELLAADEVWLSSSMRHLLPVVAIDDQPVGDGSPGAYYQYAKRLLLEHYQAV